MTRRMSLGGAAWVALLLVLGAAVQADELPEYRLKAAFIYNFIVYTDWPADTGTALNLCIHGVDPFGAEIDGLNGKVAADRRIAVHRKAAGESLKGCNVVYFSPSGIDALPKDLARLRGQAALSVADSPGAAHQGVALNMAVQRGRVTFVANLPAARGAGLNLSSKLLRLATEVIQ